MTLPSTALLGVAFAVFLGIPVPSEAQTKPKSSREAQRERAVERCKANRGVDCESAEGLKEWLLLERSRKEAVAAGSRRRAPAPPPAR